MFIMGCDFHTRFQRIAMLDTQTGELVERRLEHENEEARTFYAALSGSSGFLVGGNRGTAAGQRRRLGGRVAGASPGWGLGQR